MLVSFSDNESTKIYSIKEMKVIKEFPKETSFEKVSPGLHFRL
jgi:hypothetical protein